MKRIPATEARHQEVTHSEEPVIIEHHGRGLVALVPFSGAVADLSEEPARAPDLATCLRVLRENRDEIEKSGVRHAGIFGSVARGDAVSDSDIDVLVDFKRRDAIDLFGFAALRERLKQLLGRDVDLVSRRALDPARDQNMLDEAVMAF